MTDPASDSTSPLSQARRLLQQGRPAEAEAAYEKCLDTTPAEVEALSFLAGCALRRGQHDRGIQLLERAIEAQPANPRLLATLGIAQDLAGQPAKALPLLQRALDSAPELYVARLHLADLLAAQGQRDVALRHYFNAIRTAQSQGQWLSESRTPPGLLPRVANAMRQINTGRRELFFGVLEPLQARYGRAALERVAQSLSIYLGDAAREGGDPRQQPKFLYFPGLPSQPFLDRAAVPWLADLERQWQAIRAEAASVLEQQGALQPFLQFSAAEDEKHFLQGAGAPPRWDAFFFYRHGEHHEANGLRCPLTAGVLETLPLARIRQHAPEICFSVLTPGTHILPHRGVTNTRVVVHLPLMVEGDCVLRAGGERHAWEEGRCVVFDDTYEHEAWNRGTRDRVILLMDAWNPYLTEAEVAALTELVATIGDFNRDSGVGAET